MSFMKSIFLSAFALLLTAQSFAQDYSWSLQDCVEHAIQQNISIKQTELDLESAAIEKKDALGNFLPTLNGNASNTWNNGLTQNVTTGLLETQTTRNSSYSISSGVRLFGGFQNWKTLDRAKLSRIAAEYNVSKLKDDIALNVAVAYLNALVAKENLKTISQQNTVTLEQIKRTQELVDGGVLPRGDLLEIQASNASEVQRIVAAQNAVDVALVNLAQLLNLKEYADFDIKNENYSVLGENILNETPEVLISKAKESRYDLKIADQNLEIAKKDYQISKGALLPTLDGFFNYNTRESGDGRNPFNGQPADFIEQLYLFDGLGYGLQLRVPIFNGWRTSNQVKRAKINIKQLELQKAQTALNLETAVYQAYTDAKAAKENYNASLKALASQELAFAYAKERYDVGLTNAFDFSQSKLRLDNAQIELTRSKYEFIFRIKVLELYFGIPVKDLKF